MYAISDKPDMWTRLRAEVLSHLGTDRAPTFDDIKEMKYLKAVINGKISNSLCVIDLIMN